jgi:iron complex transport system ATP-binding protein
MSLLQAENLSCGYAGKPVLEAIRFDVQPGEFVGLLGPNGAGKSTLLKTIARLIPPLAGGIILDGQSLTTYPQKELAKKMAYMPQNFPPDETWRARDLVNMGRFPHQRGWGLNGSANDRQAVEAALLGADLVTLADKPMGNLSGGQRQRVYLARALAQESSLLLLDEPISQLDLSHQLDFFHLIRRIMATRPIAVLAVLHDLNLAAQFCDRMLVTKDGALLANGPPEAVLRPDVIEAAFGVSVTIRQHPETGLPYVVPLKLRPVEPEGTSH